MVLALAGCGSSHAARRGSTSATSSTSVTAAASTTTSRHTTPSLPGASTTPVSVAPTLPVRPLVEVRAAPQPGLDYERVVFQLDGGVPGYWVRYVPRPVTADGSGAPVAVDGVAILEVTLADATGHDDSGRSVTRTPDRFRPPGTTAIREIVRTGDFEGRVTWAIGLATQVPFRVQTFVGPPRLVIDLPN